jgi:hypothetical protein
MNSVGKLFVVVAMVAALTLASRGVPVRAVENRSPAGPEAAGRVGQEEAPVRVPLQQLQQKYLGQKEAYDKLQQEFEQERLDGRVLSVRPDGLLEVSVGARHGLKKGHRLEISHVDGGKPTWRGRVELAEVALENSTAKVIEVYPFAKTAIQQGDRALRQIPDDPFGDPLREVNDPFPASAGKEPDEASRTRRQP